MMRWVWLSGFLTVGIALAAAVPAQAEQFDGSKAFTKLARGAVNVVTGWVEIPKRIHDITQRSGAGTGFTLGLLKGFGYGFIRTAAGLYEVFTFPFPAPSGYAPVMVPDYVFSTATSSGDYQY